MPEQSNFKNDILDDLTHFRFHSNFEADFESLILKADSLDEDISMVILDIDEFEQINKKYGNDVGDKILKIISETLPKFFPGDHFFYRYGGDCFAILLSGMEKEKAFLRMEKAREALSLCEGATRFTVSAGVATYSEDGNTTAEIVRKAEGALYRAKVSGRNKVAIARDEKMITKTSHYATEQLQRLSELAKDTGCGEAFLLREALSDLLKKYDDKRRFLNGKTAIVVDDASFMRSILRDTMAKSGYKVLGDFENGKAASAYYNEVPVDFVLLDIMMPVMDGIDFLKTIKKRDNTRVIVISALSKDAVVLSAVENGADYFLVKPFKEEALLNVLSWEAGAYLKADKIDNYRSYYKGKRYGDDASLSQAEIDALRML